MVRAPLFTELPRALILGNLLSSTRIGIRDRGRMEAHRGVLRVEAHAPCNGAE